MERIYKLEKPEYEKVRPLFKNLHYQLAVESLIDGTNPGWILVDDTENPQSVWMHNSEGYFLAGSSNNSEFNNILRIWIENYIIAGAAKNEGSNHLYFGIDTDEWKQAFSEIVPTRHPLPVQRIHYLCTEVKVDWRKMVPEGYEVHRVSREFLTALGDNVPSHLHHWIKSNWESIENFENLGFGFCTTHENMIISYCLCDCVSEDECEVGIQTVEDYRRRGFATITAAAAVEYALSNEYAVVGWHTHDHNYGSIGTAEKIGFVKEREYEQYFCMFNEAMHYAETGMKLFFNEDYERALENLERSFKLGEVPHWAYYLAARISTKSSDFDKALTHLTSAARLGCDYIDHLLSNDEFEPLHTRSEWSDIVTQIKSNSKED